MSWDLKKIIEKLKKMTSESKTRKGCSEKRENPASTIPCQQLHLNDAFKPINQI